MKKGKRFAISLLVLLAFASVISSAAYATTASVSNCGSENESDSMLDSTIDSVERSKEAAYQFLDDNMLDYSYVEIEGGVFTVVLNSSGDGAVTLEDAQAILSVYDFVHSLDATSPINDVQLCIYDNAGKKIYDLFEADVRSARVSVDSVPYNAEIRSSYASTDDIVAAAETMVAENCDADIESLTIQKSPTQTSDCLTLVLSVDDVGESMMDDCNCLFDEFGLYAYETEEYTKCAITVEDSGGEALIFMGGDFEYGDSVTWINPDANFVTGIGPAPTPTRLIQHNARFFAVLCSIYHSHFC